MQRKESLLHQRRDQIAAPFVGLLGQRKPGVLIGRGQILDPETVGARLGRGAVLVLPLGEVEEPLHCNLVAHVGFDLAGLDAEKIAPAAALFWFGRRGIVLHAEAGEG